MSTPDKLKRLDEISIPMDKLIDLMSRCHSLVELQLCLTHYVLREGGQSGSLRVADPAHAGYTSNFRI